MNFNERMVDIKKLKKDPNYELLWCRHGNWLIEQAEKLEEIKKYFYAEDKDVVECFRLMIQVFEGKEAPTRNKRS